MTNTTKPEFKKLSSCPFCGSDNIQYAEITRHEDGGQFFVGCATCLSKARYSPTLDEAAKAWNTRAPQWQPIETAPKDGTKVLVCCIGVSSRTKKREGQIVVDFWNKDFEYWGEFNRDYFPATHWMPLPTPPVGE